MNDIYKQRLNASQYHKEYRNGDKVVLEVRFTSNGKTYCYEADSEPYYPGEKVMVDTTESYKDVAIYSVYYYKKEDYPFYSLPLKKIVRKLDDAEPTKKTATKPYIETAVEDFSLEKVVDKSPLRDKDSDTLPDASADVQNYKPNSSQYQQKRNPWHILVIIALLIVFFGPTIRKSIINSSPLDTGDVLGVWSNYDGSMTFHGDGSFSYGSNGVGGSWRIIDAENNEITIHYSLSKDAIEDYNEMMFEDIPELYNDTDGQGFTEEEIIDEMK